MNVTASKIGLAMACTHPWTGGYPWVYSRHASANLGTAIHALCERYVRDGEVDVDGVALEFSLQPAQTKKLPVMFDHWRRWADPQDQSGWVVEAAFAIDPSCGEARMLKGKHHRDYSEVQAHEFAGTADVVDLSKHQTMVADYKTGAWADAPQDSAQMRALAYAVSRAFVRPDVVAKIVRITPDGVVELAHHFDALELALIEDELHDLYQRLRMPTGPSAGAHCRFCPVREACPENFFRTMKESES